MMSKLSYYELGTHCSWIDFFVKMYTFLGIYFRIWADLVTAFKMKEKRILNNQLYLNFSLRVVI